MVDTSIIMQAARTPDVNLPNILQRSAESAAAIENLPLLRRQQEARAQMSEQAVSQNEINFNQQQQINQQQDAVRKAKIIYNYAKQLKSLPQAQRRTYLNTIDRETINDLGFGDDTFAKISTDDGSIDTMIAQIEPIIQADQKQIGARRSESLAGGRITAQELDDGTVRYLEYGQEIPQDQVQGRVAAAQQEYIADQQELSRGRRGGALGAEEEFKPRIARAETSAKTEAKGAEDRAQATIDAGVTASYSLPTMRRSLELLDSVATGGFDNAALRVKQLFGVEGADEGELSGNLGKAVASQLKETFGAAFTNEERKSFERIEAGFGKNAEVNKRLLNNALKVAERKVDSAISRAEARGDTETVEELKSNMQYRLGGNEQDTPANTGGASTDEFEGFEIIE
jgi:hypothetical protein